MAEEFQSQLAEAEWGKYQKHLMERSNKQRPEDSAATKDAEIRLEEFRARNGAEQASLDEKIDKLQAAFADTILEASFDADRLEKQYLTGTKGGTNGGAGPASDCLQARTNVSVCLKEKGSSGCDDFIRAMQTCVGAAVAGKA